MASKTARIPPETGARGLRADARKNREKLLAAAEEVFSTKGADASLEDVARRAKVGIGTLYRHFPTREALLAAACDERLEELAAESLARDTKAMSAGDALRTFLEQLVRHACTYRGLAASLGVVLQNASTGCHATTVEGQRLLKLAQRAGDVRKDVDFDDVVCMATAVSLAAAQSSDGMRRIPRLVRMFVDGIRTT